MPRKQKASFYLHPPCLHSEGRTKLSVCFFSSLYCYMNVRKKVGKEVKSVVYMLPSAGREWDSNSPRIHSARFAIP